MRFYLSRIAETDRAGPTLNSIISLNPEAERDAAGRDAERQRHDIRGPLHGIPILVKDNIETADEIATTAGSLALKDNVTRRDAPVVARLRQAGAVILGKTNLSEWANIRSVHSVSGWSAIGGLTRNPHVLDRSASGSSSGSAAAIAANLAGGAVGTETDGSIVSPANLCGIVGLKPTVGLLSRTHIIPISMSQDTPGPMTRSVEDAAILLACMAGSDRADPATRAADARRQDYTHALSEDAFKDARLGIWRPRRVPEVALAVFEQALAVLKARGATLVAVGPMRVPETFVALEFAVMLTEFKAGLRLYLSTVSHETGPRSLADVIQFNRSAPRELVLFGQDLFEQAEATKGIEDPAYKKARAGSRRMARRILDAALEDHRLDALIAPTGGPAWRIDLLRGGDNSGSASSLPAVAGYPHLTVPMGAVSGLPVGISFIGRAWSEARLLSLGHAFEVAARARIAPQFQPSLEGRAAAFGRP